MHKESPESVRLRDFSARFLTQYLWISFENVVLLVCRRQSAKTLRWHFYLNHLDFERGMRSPLGKTRKLILLGGCGFSEQDHRTLQ